MIVEFPYTLAEAMRSRRAVTANVKGFWFAVHILPVIGAAGLFSALYLVVTGAATFSDVLMGIILCAFFASLPIWIRFEIVRQFRRNPNAEEMIQWEFTPEKITVSTAGSQSSFEWRMLIEAKELKDGFLLYAQPRLAHWIPKHGFANTDELERFRTLLRTSGIKFRG